MTTSEPKAGLRDLVVCDDRRNPEATERLAVTLGYQPLADRQRPERPRPQFLTEFAEELIDATRFDVTASGGIHAGCP